MTSVRTSWLSALNKLLFVSTQNDINEDEIWLYIPGNIRTLLALGLSNDCMWGPATGIQVTQWTCTSVFVSDLGSQHRGGEARRDHVYKKHAAMSRKRVKGRDYPWQDNELHHVMDIRYRAKVKTKQTRYIEDFENYKTLRNKSNIFKLGVKNSILYKSYSW